MTRGSKTPSKRSKSIFSAVAGSTISDQLPPLAFAANTLLAPQQIVAILPHTVLGQNFYPIQTSTEVLTIFSDKAFAANILLAPPPIVAASLHICHMVATNIDMVDNINIATNITKHTLFKILHSRICVIEIKLKLMKLVHFVRGKLPKTINN